jgi:hypothetical protein
VKHANIVILQQPVAGSCANLLRCDSNLPRRFSEQVVSRATCNSNNDVIVHGDFCDLEVQLTAIDSCGVTCDALRQVVEHV